ncbi:MAG: hypothetical protein IPK16_28250 [Anaerolineales bacterium]|nr:hypothetical protein [Anaerolineales bacterium]
MACLVVVLVFASLPQDLRAAPPFQDTPIPDAAITALDFSIMRAGLFAGQASTSVTGEAGPGISPRYSFPGLAGQSVTIVLNSQGNAANFRLSGASDGIVYKDFSDPSLNYSRVLPAGQTYIITVASPTTVAFYMEVTLGDPGTPTPISPTRITFMPGQTTATESGNFAPGQSLQYVFAGGAGQSVTVSITSPGNTANFSLQGVTDGILYKSDSAAPREVTFPSSIAQDYLIGVVAPAATSYILQVTLPGALPPTPAPERITFMPGQSVAVVNGALQPGVNKQYIFAAAAGQNIRILLASLVAGAATFGLQGASDGVVYKQPADPQNEWSFVVPVSQDYVITLVSTTNTTYTLELTIPIPQPITVTPAPTIPVGCTTDTIFNGDFSNNAFWIFGDSPVPAAYIGTMFHSPPRSVRLGVDPDLGVVPQLPSFSSIRQTFQIPPSASTAQLRWWRYYRTEEAPTNAPAPGQDQQQVVILKPDNSTVRVLRSTRQNDPQWVEEVVDLTTFIGRPLQIYFNAFNDTNGLRTWQFLDDVSIVVCYPPSTPTPSITLYANPQPVVEFQSLVTLAPPITTTTAPAENVAPNAAEAGPKDEPTVVLVLPPMSTSGSQRSSQGGLNIVPALQVIGILLGILGLIAVTALG